MRLTLSRHCCNIIARIYVHFLLSLYYRWRGGSEAGDTEIVDESRELPVTAACVTLVIGESESGEPLSPY